MYRKLIIAALLAPWVMAVWAMDHDDYDVDAEDAAPQVEVLVSRDLAADARLATERGVPLLVMFAQEGCAYCELVESEFLRPMILSGDYEDRVVIRKLMLDSFDSIRDFDGSSVEVETLATRFNAPLTPTLVFLSPQGRELAPRLIGISTVDFYGGDLEARIDTALATLRRPQMAVQ